MCRESREDKECLLTKSRKDKKDRKRIVVAATGASGLPILKMCLQIIRGDSDYESILILMTRCRHIVLTVFVNIAHSLQNLDYKYKIKCSPKLSNKNAHT